MNTNRFQEARILIVDDDATNVLLLEEILKNAGYTHLRSTQDGRGAASCFSEFKPDLVLLDYLMKPLDGCEVMGTLRPLIPADAYLPIMVLTADMSPVTREKALSEGAKDFIAKPLDVTEVLLRIRNLVETRFLHLDLRDQNLTLEDRVSSRTAELLAANSALAAEVKGHQRTTEALKGSERRFRSLVETTSDWVWEADAKGMYTYASPRVRELLGYDPEDLVGHRVFGLVAPEDTQRAASVLERILRGADSMTHFEHTDQHKDGRLLVLETSIVPIFSAQDQVVGCRGIDRDASERKQLEGQLRHAQKMEAVGRLASGVAHDFNNLLTVILGYTQMMMSQDQDAGSQELLKAVLVAAEKAGKLSRQLLTFSRTKVTGAEPLDLNELLGELVDMLARVLGEDVRLHANLAEKLPRVQADAGMLEQVLMNLVVNARDAMPKGGDLYISTYQASLDTAYARKRLEAKKGEHIVLSVRDTGSGITPDILSRMFDPFFTTKPPDQGTGLGLAMVYGIVKQHAGWVEVESEVGEGTTFKVFLPGVPQVAEHVPPRAVEKQVVRGSETVLVVEDEPTVRTLARLVLQQHGYKVLTAASGAEALRVWEAHADSIEVLLTDVVMPDGKTGRELAEELRTLKPGLRIICTSGYGLNATGMDTAFMNKTKIRFLQKPFRPQTLARLIREALDGAG